VAKNFVKEMTKSFISGFVFAALSKKINPAAGSLETPTKASVNLFSDWRDFILGQRSGNVLDGRPNGAGFSNN
jgi:hypothetical protein